MRAAGRFPVHLYIAMMLTGFLVSETAFGAVPQRIVFPVDPYVLNVKTAFGAAGNGTTDDTQALQRALDSSSSPPSRAVKAIYLPKGTYRVRQTLVVNRNATGHGIGPFRQAHVLHLETRRGGEEIYGHRVARQLAEGQGGHEPAGGRGHDHLHRGAALA